MLITVFVVGLIALLLIGMQLMSDPTASINRWFEPYWTGTDGARTKAKIVSSEALVRGGFVGQIYGNGEARFMADEANDWPMGLVVEEEFHSAGATVAQQLTGTALDTEGDRGVIAVGECIIRHDSTTRPCLVTGVAAYSDIGKPVYLTDGQTMTLTRPSDDAIPMGFVFDKSRASTDTSCDVYVFGKVTSWLLSCAGGNKRRIVLATIEFADIADNNKITHVLWGHGLIKKVGVNPWKAVTTGSKASTFTGDIGGTAITTGAISMTSAGLGTAGTEQAVEPTAANEFHDGDVFNGTFSSTTTFAEGSGYFFLDVEYLPGA